MILPISSFKSFFDHVLIIANILAVTETMTAGDARPVPATAAGQGAIHPDTGTKTDLFP